jgi:hypothetical protein
MRVVVTGVSNRGETIVVSDGEAAGYQPKARAYDAEFIHILASDAPASLPCDGTQLKFGPSFFPVPGGFRYWIFTMPAGSSAPPIPADATQASDNAGMAYADTIEWVIVLAGEIEHVLPGGKRLLLKTGDSIVQIGARHRWENTSDAPCVMAVAAVGAIAATPSPWMGTPS